MNSQNCSTLCKKLRELFFVPLANVCFISNLEVYKCPCIQWHNIYMSSLELSHHIIINHTEQLGFSNTILIGHLRKTLFCLKCTNRVLIYVIEILGTNLNTFFKLSKFKNLYLRHCFKCFSFFFFVWGKFAKMDFNVKTLIFRNIDLSAYSNV